jgi:PAS domain S-box-containing protein
LVVTTVAVLLRKLLDPVLGEYSPYITLYPTIVFLAIYAGLGVAVVSAIFGVLGITYWFMLNRSLFHLGASAHWVGSLLFLLVSACIIIAVEINRRSQMRLRRTKTLFETVLDNSPSAEYMKDEAGRYVYVNRTGRIVYPLDFVGKTDFELFPAVFASQWRANDSLVLETNNAMEFLETSPGPDAERTWISVKFPVIDTDGRRLLVGKSVDISEMKRAEAQLRRFLEAAPSGLSRCSRDLKYLSANVAYAEIAGLPLEQIIGRRIDEVMGPDNWGAIQPHVERVLRGERVEYEMRLPNTEAGSAHLHVVHTPERDGQEVVGWVSSVTDITEFKRVERQLQQMEKIAAAGKLAASLAHEINNPLAAVVNILFLLKDGSGLDAANQDLIEKATEEAARISRIIRQSLSYYRVGMAPQEVDFSALAEQSFQIFNDKFQRAGIAIVKEIEPGTSILGFADEIRQVADNLLVNAAEATPQGGRLTLRLRQSRSWKDRSEQGARLTIADNGSGIPKTYLARIFEPFFTTKAEKGNGLGLWVVKGIVEKHGASIKIRSSDAAVRSGTAISIFWPSAFKASPTPKHGRSQQAA